MTIDTKDDVLVFEKRMDDTKEFITDSVPSADIINVCANRKGLNTVDIMFEVNNRGEMQETIDPYYLNESEYIDYFTIPRPLDYSFFIETDQNKYYIEHGSGYCVLNYRYYIDYSFNDTHFLTSFQLHDANEIIKSVAVQLIYFKISNNSETVTHYIDLASENYFFRPDIDAASTAGTCELLEFIGCAYDFTDNFVKGLHGVNMNYEWDFGDGTTKQGSMVNHRYDQAGNYRVELRVTNNTGITRLAIHNITVDQGDCVPPEFEIITPSDGVYLFGFKMPLFSFRSPFIIGDINITVDAFDEQTGIDRVEFIIDDECHYIDHSAPYSYTWIDESRFLLNHKHLVQIRCYDGFQNLAEKEITVFKFY